MVEKKKVKTRKSMRSLPAKAISAKTAKGVKGGSTPKQQDNPTESMTLNYEKINWKY
jgi:hypothetical protein